MGHLAWWAAIAIELCMLEVVFSQTLYNSTLACTRGAGQTNFAIDCRDVYPDGATRVLSFSRVFFGATPNTSGCSRTAPYANCCARNTTTPDCTFPVDAELQEIVDKCTGASYCSFSGKRLSTSLGNCDQNIYPSLTSFSFVEYNCTVRIPTTSTTTVTTMVLTTASSSSSPGVTIIPKAGTSFNSSLACTRGADQTYHGLDCRDHYQDGGNRSLSINRVFYGTTPLSSGCNRTAPYANCCVRDPNKVDCVFQNDVELQDIIEKCSGVSYCAFSGLRVSSSLGNCDPNNYPSLTSFSFIEYQCLPRQVTNQICSDIIDQQIGQVYLESNTVLVGRTVTNTTCQCLITTDCDSTLNFYGIIVQLTQINATSCAEEITFADVRYPQLTARVTCADDDNVLYNQSLFTSMSNVASFHFRVSGQQQGKIYIRAQSSVSTANVTLTCGTPVAQALNQIQQCPNQTTTTPSTTPTPLEGPINSSLACTRGAQQTYHDLDCRDHYQDGGNRSLSINRVFYGTTPLSSGCNRTAPYANCCVRDPNKVDCVFQNDVELQDIIEKCSGVSYCAFSGLRVSSSLGNCDPNNYPSLTSFSFIEYQCLPRQVTSQICGDIIDQQKGQVYLESNTVLVGRTVTDTTCQCLITTDCDSTLNFYGIIVQLTQINATSCAEEITFADVRYPQLTARVTCADDDNVLYNQSLFTSMSNVASFHFRVSGQQQGKIYIRAQSSVSTANVTLTCGTLVAQALNQIQQCPNQTTTTPSTTPTPLEGPINSSLACTRGAQQTYHDLDCRNHYQDGGNRSLSINRVFYGTTPLSSGCNRTAPYANCCVRDPNKVDCVFQNDVELQDIIEKCSGVSYCAFSGLRVSSSLGNCDPNNYPSLTSFSFIEYQCLPRQFTSQICGDIIDQQKGQVYLESNTVLVGRTVTDTTCQCLITTDCDSTLNFYGIIVQLTQINATSCAEEITFADVRYPQLTARVTCADDDNVLYNQSLFTSMSNVASFHFRVSGQQQGKIYIRAQSSVSTANVTLTCGTPVAQALNQIQQCPNQTTTTPSTTPTPLEGPINSSLACTRGAQQTYHDLDCRDHYQDGGNRSLSINRVFYGTTPLSSGCNRTAPYANCCVRDPNKVDCVFQNDVELQDIIKKCSGVSYCAFPGLRVSSSLGNCDPNNYPSLTSFSFIEYQCLPRQFTSQICGDIIDQQKGQVYLESNTVLVGRTVTNTTCQCLITTDCDSTLNFYGIIVQLTQINATSCAEEITFADVRYPQLTARVTCADDDNVLYNQSLFTSMSNVASFHFRVSGQQQGKIYIRAQSSVSTANVTLTCGTLVAQALNQIQQCPNQTTTTPSTTPKPFEGPINSSLACTRGAQQTYHDLDCRDHYQDGGNRSLSINRVFYGTTPLSSGCNRTAPYANCCVRDPNKVDCVFQNDVELQDIIEKCSGVSYCAFSGLRVSSSLGNCDPNNYPSLTSFSFIEYQCLPRQVTSQICGDIIDQQKGQVYLESNTVLVGRTVTDTTCQCLITTDCDSTLNFYGIIVQLTQINATSCAEEITFADVRYPQLTARVTCADDDNVLYNQSLFTSMSNVASFHFRVSGQQQGKIYIRAQSSVSTANVTLTCGTPVAQALNQIQQCPNQTTTTPSTTPKPFEGPINSSLACTRGAQQTYHDLDCRDHYQDGGNRSLSINRVFYGTTPLSSGCNRTAPYANCCVRDPNKVDCVFQNDVELQDIIEKCSGVSYCAFSGLRVSSSLGNCDPNNYPSLTSFSFIEYQCLPRQFTSQICGDIIDQQKGQVYLESNTVLVGRTVTDTTCQCLITTDCDSTLNFYGIIVQLTQINATSCAEEITFADVRYPQLTARVTCADDDNVLYNQSLFTSMSNVASFHFRVSGQQQGKIYIRAQSSVSTANVTLTCGTPVAQALNQIQQCPNQTTTTPSTTPTPLEGPINSSLACTRGAQQTYHDLDCRDHYQDGGNRSLSINRVFYGTTPLSSGCNRTAPYANCCVRDPNKVDCVFQNDVELQDIIEKCSGVSYCAFPGLRVSSSLGNCDPNNYPSLTSFSFIEYQCLPRQVTSQICGDIIDHQIGQVYLESNTVLVGRTVTDTTCQCLITTDCDSTLNFYGIIVQLTQINATSCAEEITFADVRYPQLTARVTCADDDNVLYNQSLFTSMSNVASFHFRVSGQQQGKIYIRAQSSVSTANVTLTCGTLVAQALNQIQQCPNQTTTTPSTTHTPLEGPINSSLACTRGAQQTYHDLDCRDHYQDGGNRSLSINRVFYGTTPLSSGCNRTAPYANCCVRDPNKVDCVFQNDVELQDIIEKCSGVSYCAFPGLRVSSSLGNCDPNNYPSLTSFSFIEYQCLPRQVTSQICGDIIDHQIGQVYLESNTVLVGRTVTDTTCQCLITTDCDSTLNFYGIIVQLTQINATSCAEEITFADVRYPQLTARVTCADDDNVLYNQSLFTSMSNVASFHFRVSGQQQGKIYIRAQSSVSTANVTLTCGTLVAQALNQIQQCPNQTTTTPSTTPKPLEGPINSSLACTRGAQQTYHDLDCRDHYQDGGNRSLSINRVFYGTTPLSSGCNRTAPYANCCVRDPNKVDCVFQNDVELQDIIEKCSGVSYCAFSGLRVSSSLGNCDPNNYPSLTSFSFIEYQCLPRQVTSQICGDIIDQQKGQVYLESNTVLVGRTVTDTTCQCLITTDCYSTLNFYGIIVQLTQINATSCAEEITFADVRYPQLTARVTCADDDNVLYNQSLFTSMSNVASFHFRVSGQQQGKIYIRAQSSVSTANVTLTCGTPVAQALNQIQQCPNQTTTTPSTTPTPLEGPINSSLACTRGAQQTYHDLDCRDHYQDGGNRSLSINRVFYGTTPLSSGCNRTAPYANCCVRDPNKVDCVFQNDVELQDIIEKCSGVSYCAFSGLRVSSSLGNCDPNNYPSLTSFSFIEYQCLPRQVTSQICSAIIDHQIGQVYLESNTVLVGRTVTDTTCQCLITTDCDSTLNFYGIIVQLTQINATSCAEEITFADVRYPQLTARVTCADHDNVLYNQSLFTSMSNVASFHFRVSGQQQGKIYIRAQSSVSTANVTLTCGTPVAQALNQIQQCPNQTTTTPSTTHTPLEGPINSSLACTRGAQQTYHDLDCRDHYQDGGNRSLSINRVFYGTTPLSSGCNRTAPYANCCVRDPNKVDCVFQNDVELQDIIEKCSGVSYCAFSGLRVSSSLGNCDPNNYPSLTSFSFIEYQCLPRQVTSQICSDIIDHQIGQVYLESNTVLVGRTVTNTTCQCLITTDCDSTLNFYGIIVQLTQINATSCAEEITFADVRYPQLTARVTCADDDNVLYNQSLFTSMSNVASFHFRVSGQQQGKIYIRAQSSVSTANVTLTCGTPVAQALNQIQQCPNQTTTTPSTIPTPLEGPINSSLACTRGAQQTYHDLDCRDHYQDGGNRSLSINRVFYGTTPLSSGCNRTAPYANCCVRDPNKVDCVFQNDVELQDIIEKCSGVSYCAFSGLRVSSSLGNCDPNNYPSLTSFSFIEYQCLPRQVTSQICSDIIDHQIGQVYLESNTVLVGRTVTDTTCQCLITTDCDSTLNFYGIIVQLTQVNATSCAEEITFADVRYPQLTARVTCADDDNVLYNQSLFTSMSNVASFHFRVSGQQQGKIYIRAQSSVSTANVTLTCGTPVAQALNQIQQCPNQTTTTFSPNTTTLQYNTSSSTTSSTATTAYSTLSSSSTTQYPSTTNYSSTSQYPSTTNYSSTTQYPSTTNFSSTTQYPSTTNYSSTTQYPSTTNFSSTTQYPSTTNYSSTTQYPSTTNYSSTTQYPSTTNYSSTTQYPSTTNYSSTTQYPSTVTVPVEGSMFNSSLACTRGAQQTYHNLDCRNHYPDGGNRSVSINRVFYGTTPLSSGCNSTAPYANCCARDPNKVDCVFQNDVELQEIIKKCSGVSYCAFAGLNVSSSLGSCDPNTYPSLTSFSFIEYQCLPRQVTGGATSSSVTSTLTTHAGSTAPTSASVTPNNQSSPLGDGSSSPVGSVRSFKTDAIIGIVFGVLGATVLIFIVILLVGKYSKRCRTSSSDSAISIMSDGRLGKPGSRLWVKDKWSKSF